MGTSQAPLDTWPETILNWLANAGAIQESNSTKHETWSWTHNGANARRNIQRIYGTI